MKHPATDIAYLLFPDALGDFFESEKELLQHFYDQLMEVNPMMGHYAFEQLEIDFEFARVDFVRYCLMKGWVACSSRDVELLQRVYHSLQRIDWENLLAERISISEVFLKFCS